MRVRYLLLATMIVGLTAFGCAHKTDAEPKDDASVAAYEQILQESEGGALAELPVSEEEPVAVAEAKTGTKKAKDAKDSKASSKAEKSAPPKTDSEATNIVLNRAHKAIGTPYVFGGTRPGGFDCSGLVQWAYKGAGISMPRTAGEQARTGYAIKDRSKMRAGDVVAFTRKGGYHTGIYLGDGKFIHAPSAHKRVRIESLDTPYFASRFIGARRVNMSERDRVLAAKTEQSDRQYAASKGKSRKASKSVASKKGSKATKTAARSSSRTAQASKSRNAAKAAKSSKTAQARSTKTAAKSSTKTAARATQAKASSKTAAKAAQAKTSKTAAKASTAKTAQKTASKSTAKGASQARKTEASKTASKTASKAKAKNG